MANLNTPTNMGQIPTSYPYTNNLIMNTPYDNYMARNVNTNQFLKCRPVSSKEEAIASQIDLDGSLWVFPDVANGKIYTKQINNDGTASFRTYAYVQDVVPQDTSDYVTKEQFNRVIQNLMAAVQIKEPIKSNENKTPAANF